MSTVGEREAKPQKRVVAFFRNTLGCNAPGSWKNRDGNRNIEEAELTKWLKRQGHGERIIGKVLSAVAAARVGCPFGFPVRFPFRFPIGFPPNP